MNKLWDTLLLIIVLFLVLVSSLVYISPRLGLSINNVGSGSMTPTLHVGTMVVANRVNPADLRVGDIIIFKPPFESQYNVCHRIVKINQAKQLSFVTRGDAVSQTDEMAIPAANVVGKVSFHADYVGYFISFLKTEVGLIAGLVVPTLYIIYLCVRNLRSEISRLAADKKVKEAKL